MNECVTVYLHGAMWCTGHVIQGEFSNLISVMLWIHHIPDQDDVFSEGEWMNKENK